MVAPFYAYFVIRRDMGHLLRSESASMPQRIDNDRLDEEKEEEERFAAKIEDAHAVGGQGALDTSSCHPAWVVALSHMYLSLGVVPENAADPPPQWLLASVPYMACIAFTDFNAYGLIVATLPFALKNATEGVAGAPASSNALLQFSYQAASLFLFFGDFCTCLPFFRDLSLKPVLWGFAACDIFIYTCALVAPLASSNSVMGPLLVVAFCAQSFGNSYLLTRSWRGVALASGATMVDSGNNGMEAHSSSTEDRSELPETVETVETVRQRASRLAGLTDQLMVFLGAVLGITVVLAAEGCAGDGR